MSLPQEHPFWSYRLAKLECAAERRGVGKLAFANFESRINKRLSAISSKTISPSELFRVPLGTVWVTPKSVTQVPRDDLVIRIPDLPDHNIQRLDIRVTLEPTPEFATAEIVYLRAFGPALQNVIPRECIGNRLDVKGKPAHIPPDGRRVFKYWAPAYRSLRTKSLAVAESLLASARTQNCVVTTLDFNAFYDNIDPQFLLDGEFVSLVHSAALLKDIPFDKAQYVAATRGLLKKYSQFRSATGKRLGVKRSIGIPIGSLSARLIANLALVELDRLIAAKPTVRFYARYVDDIVVVEAGRGGAEVDPDTTLQRLLPLVPNAQDVILLDNSALNRPGSVFRIQMKKVKIFDLRGDRGREYLKTIDSDLKRLSSERRRFLEAEPEQLAETTIGSSSKQEQIAALREADVLSLKKYAVGMMADKVALAASMLESSQASIFSRKFLGQAGRLSTDWSRWVDFIEVALRILTAALMARDFVTSEEVIKAIVTQAEHLGSPTSANFPLYWGSDKLDGTRSKRVLMGWFLEKLVEVISCAAPLTKKGVEVRPIKSLKSGIRVAQMSLGTRGLTYRAKLLAAADLRAAERETEFLFGAPHVTRPPDEIESLAASLQAESCYTLRTVHINSFLSAATATGDRVYQGLHPVEVLLLSRPPSYYDIALRWVKAEKPISGLLEVVNGVRGTRYRHPTMLEVGDQVVVLDSDGSHQQVCDPRLILANLNVSNQAWADSLATPAHCIQRHNALTSVLNDAIRASRTTKAPSILVLPELALPRGWIRQVCLHLSRSAPSLSLIAGLEYERVGDAVYNEVLAFVPRPYHSCASFTWTKRHPATHEDHHLTKLKRRFASRREARRFTVLRSEHGAILPLICSELLEIEARSKLAYKVDLVLVPAWNQDTTSFDSLIASTALELHAYVAVCNNGLYSDSRVRAPYAAPWAREVARKIDRGANNIIYSDLEVLDLRRYQEDPVAHRVEEVSNRKKGQHPPPPKWKPLPPGYTWQKI